MPPAPVDPSVPSAAYDRYASRFRGLPMDLTYWSACVWPPPQATEIATWSEESAGTSASTTARSPAEATECVFANRTKLCCCSGYALTV